MITIKLDPHTNYPANQCVSVDRIEYEIQTRGYYRHPRLGRLHAGTISFRALMIWLVVWIAVTLGIINFYQDRQAAWVEYSANQNETIAKLITRLHSQDEGELPGCIDTVVRMRTAVDNIDTAARGARKAHPHDKQVAALCEIMQYLKRLL